MSDRKPEVLGSVAAALGASIELAAPVVALAFAGYYLGKRYGDAVAFLGMVAGIFLGLAVGIRTLIKSYARKP